MRTFISLLTSILLLGAVDLRAAVIDFNSCQAVAGYSQAQMDAIGQQRFYFEHASVGANMISGLSALHSLNASFYELSSVSSSATPPLTTSGGYVYEYSRGNPGWKDKVDDFAADMLSWASKIDIALNKFCYIDQDANLTYYENSMVALEAAHPGTHFVYMTIPLTYDSNQANADRNIFNNALRQWAIANDKILFDVADIEAHDPQGNEQTFTWGSETYQKLYSGYTSDGGHLNSTGAELVARGFYAVGDAVVSVPEPSTGWILVALTGLCVAGYRRLRGE